MSNEPRLRKLTPGHLTPEQRVVYDAIAGGRRAQGPQLFRLVDDDGGLEGPFNAFLLQPALGGALQSLGGAVRYETSLSARAREIAILVVAARWDSAFEWYAHEAVGRHAGLTDAELKAVQERRYDGLSGDEALVAGVVDALVDGDLDDVLWETATATLGLAQVFELTTLVGYYATLALQLRVFRAGVPGAGDAVDIGCEGDQNS